MSDEIDQIILADSVSAVAEQPPRRRGIFGLRRRSKLPAIPLTHCENCGAPLTGEFCAQCGQHAIDYRRSIFRVVLDAADSFLNWDTKFLQTMNMLLFRPWKLTNDFNAGRRARYVHPLRLYLIASVLFFLLARALNLQAPGEIELTAQDRGELVASLGKLTEPDSPLSPEQREKVEVARTKLSEGAGVLTDEERRELKTTFKDFLKSTLRQKLDPGERAKMATPSPVFQNRQIYRRPNRATRPSTRRTPVIRQALQSQAILRRLPMFQRPHRKRKRRTAESISGWARKTARKHPSKRGWNNRLRTKLARTAARPSFSWTR